MRAPIRNQRPGNVPRPEEENRHAARPEREQGPKLPHERDEAPDPPASTPGGPHDIGPRQVIEQAGSDIRRGLRDTERRGTPSDVPGPGAAPERSPGAAVPEEGVDVAGHSPRRKPPPASFGG
jgi:hypothetical protein